MNILRINLETWKTNYRFDKSLNHLWLWDDLIPVLSDINNPELNEFSIEALIKHLDTSLEPAYTWVKWRFCFKEILVRFWKWVNICDALSHFKERWKTLELLMKMVGLACNEISNSWSSVSVNIFLKDLEDDWIIPYFKELDIKNDLSKLILEILEEPYWELTENALRNLKKLSDMWLIISIDDFTLLNLDNWKNISLRNLNSLLAHWIPIKYVKLDWKFLMSVLERECWGLIEKMLESIIDYLHKNWIQVVWEWIWNEQQAIESKNIWIDLFQWRNLPIWFHITDWIPNWKEVKSFCISGEVSNFSITHGWEVLFSSGDLISFVRSAFNNLIPWKK